MTTFDELSGRRRAYVESARANGFEEGLRRLLADLYPDNAHFIYELLQNAEDADASQMIFNLEPDRLVVEHNGTRAFDLADIDSITGIGHSTKANDVTRIGKFGVGFKAVFAYTSEPEIRSGDYSFVIRDLFVPELVPGAARSDWTTFTFPFDRTDKPQRQACDEITRGLIGLGENTLLFLNSVRSVMYMLPGGEEGLLERRDVEPDRFTMYHEGPGGTKETHWLRIAGFAEIDEDGTTDPVPIAAAFHLVLPDEPRTQPKARKKDSSPAVATQELIVDALETGQVSIYFPAVNETSGLRFHIHAPFASTVARDSVRATPGNNLLIQAIADLVADALPALRDRGFLTDGLLAALPNANDQVPERYEIIREAVVHAFRTEELTYVHAGGGALARAEELLSSPPAFRRSLSVGDLNYLASLHLGPQDPPYRWVSERSGRTKAFLDSLSIAPFGWPEMAAALRTIVRGPYLAADERKRSTGAWTRWLNAKDAKALRKWYALLGEGHQDSDTDLHLPDLPLIRLIQRGKPTYVMGADAFLPATRSDTAATRIPADLAVFEKDERTKENIWLTAFYSAAGVMAWNESTRVLTRLAVYEEERFPDPESRKHLEDIRLFYDYVKADPSRKSQFYDVNFLLTIDLDGELAWTCPKDVYIDAPYESTGLRLALQEVRTYVIAGESHLYATGDTMYGLWDGYLEKIDTIREFAILVGCQSELSLTPCTVERNPKYRSTWASPRRTEQGLKRDYDIKHFDRIVASQDPNLLRLLWNAVASAPFQQATAVYQANRITEQHILPSRIAQRLEATAWILDVDGILRTPASMTEADLAPGLTLPSTRQLISEVGFGRDALSSVEARASFEAAASAVGMASTEVAAIFAGKFGRLSADQQIALLHRMDASRPDWDVPDGASAAPERRSALAASDARTAPQREFAIRPRSVLIDHDELRAQAKEYLRTLYRTRTGSVVCQICQQPMPFQVKGRDYFEAVQFIAAHERDHRQNRLALCPLCAAKYKHVRGTDDSTLLEDLRTTRLDTATAWVDIALVVADKPGSLRFTAKHAIDALAALATDTADALSERA